jgi:hypothetical protein
MTTTRTDITKAFNRLTALVDYAGHDPEAAALDLVKTTMASLSVLALKEPQARIIFPKPMKRTHWRKLREGDKWPKTYWYRTRGSTSDWAFADTSEENVGEPIQVLTLREWDIRTEIRPRRKS